jgi:hypothetical protein
MSPWNSKTIFLKPTDISEIYTIIKSMKCFKFELKGASIYASSIYLGIVEGAAPAFVSRNVSRECCAVATVESPSRVPLEKMK